MDKTIIVKLDVAAYIGSIIASSQVTDDGPKIAKELQLSVYNVMKSEGFMLTKPLDTEPSRRNGGWAYYDDYKYVSSESNLKVIVNIRSADHSSKPDLATKNKKRLSALERNSSKEDKDANLAVLDTYYTERDWGVQYYIGKGDKYSDPVDSLDKISMMLKGQLSKLKDRYL